MLQAGLTPVIEWTGESGDGVYTSGEELTTFPVIWHVFNLNKALASFPSSQKSIKTARKRGFCIRLLKKKYMNARFGCNYHL